VTREPVVAVCTNRSPAAVAGALTALSEQAPPERIVVVTSGLAPAQVAAHRALAPGRVVEEARPGLSLARNRALEWAPAGGAIAFVDDDVVVDPGWWDALATRWANAGDEVGVIGGPIRPRWATPPPEWVSAPILGTLTLLDLGPDERVLDPDVTALYGANVSFAVDPLRAAGGFDPAYGHSGARIFFAEEDEAQRALARAGYRVLYAPELGVQHVIPAERLTRRSFARRRFAYGRALGMRGGRGAGVALRQLTTSGPGALVALASNDRRLFMERAVRAAENAGVLTGLPRRRKAAAAGPRG
jgi:glycosyltransferase involved in cell wall biosynthesis